VCLRVEFVWGACIVKFGAGAADSSKCWKLLMTSVCFGRKVGSRDAGQGTHFLYPVLHTLSGLFSSELLSFWSDRGRDGFLRYVPCSSFINKEMSFFTWLCGRLMKLDGPRAWCGWEGLGIGVYRRVQREEAGFLKLSAPGAVLACRVRSQHSALSLFSLAKIEAQITFISP